MFIEHDLAMSHIRWTAIDQMLVLML